MNDTETYGDGYNRLLDNLRGYSSLAVAFSGGTDSTFLLLTACEVLGDKVMAFTVKTPYIPDWEIKEAMSFCTGHHIRHKIIELALPEIIRGNPEDRCYRCKRQLFEILLRETAASGIEKLVDGTNADDLKDYRPGFKALQELSVGSPLLESGLTSPLSGHFQSRWDCRPGINPLTPACLRDCPITGIFLKQTWQELKKPKCF
jgi:uncharacterized protein